MSKFNIWKQVTFSGLLWIALELSLVTAFYYKYDVEHQSDGIFTPCEDYPNNTYDKYLDFSRLSIVRGDDGYFTIEGVAEVIYDMEPKGYPSEVELFKRVRGVWQKTIYSLRSENLCPTLFKVKGYWSSTFDSLLPEEKECPITKGSHRNKTIARKQRNFAGHVINIGSYAVHVVPHTPGFSLNIYAPTKHAVKAMTEVLRQEFLQKETKIKVTSISPGGVRTEFLGENVELPPDWSALSSADIADAIVYALQTPPHVQIHDMIIKAVGEVM